MKDRTMSSYPETIGGGSPELSRSTDHWISGAKVFRCHFWRRAILLVLLLLICQLMAGAATARPNIVLWDTGGSSLEHPADWKTVPSDLLSLETDPPKASSDPGYYGRDYSFKGDPVVQNAMLTVCFSSSRGSVILYSKNCVGEGQESVQAATPLGTQVAELVPGETPGKETTISRVEVVRNAGDCIMLRAFFSADGQPGTSCLFRFGKNNIIEIRPEAMKRLRLRSELRYLVAPSFIGDDLIFDPQEYSSETKLCVAAEDLLLGLMEGEQAQIAIAWAGHTSPSVEKGQQAGTFQAIDFAAQGQSLFIAPLSAPGIWHREPLNASFLEKDVPLGWTRPFPAKWKTQLFEEGVKTSFSFRNAKGQIWRGVPGSYNYPAWFEGDKAVLHLSKKVAPRGDALIYFLEGQETPVRVLTPADFLQDTLGRTAAETVLDEAGRKLRTHHRRGGDGVRRACTCGCTEAIQAVFQAGEESNRKEYVEGAVEDMIYFVHRHVDRINEYKAFAAELSAYLKDESKKDPGIAAFAASLQEIVNEIPQEYEVQKENMKSFGYADDLARRTLALTGHTDTNNFNAYMELSKAWRDMGGAQDYVLARCHMITRKLCQEAGYGCARQASAVPLAMEVRKRCKLCLRNPDGYEIWADY